MREAVQIEVFDNRANLQEVWVKALTNEMTDWPRIEARLTTEQAELLERRARDPYTHELAGPLKYYPHLVTPDEREEHGYMFEDWFIFRVVAPLSAAPSSL